MTVLSADEEKKIVQKYLSDSMVWLIFLAVFNIVLHSIFNANYGFHRDELATVDDARYLAWGYVAYPPVTPFIGRIAAEIFGNSSLVGLRFFAALAMSASIVLTGLMAHALGGKRFAQMTAAVAVLVAPIVIIQGAVFQYVSFDYLWWVAIAFCFVKLLQTENPRWWLGIGAFIGVGMMTKYTIGLLVIGLIVGVISTRARHFLKSPWLWAGAAISLLIWLPNVIWQINHGLISLDFLKSIHERDVRIGRTGGFLSEQFLICANFVTVPLVFAGIWFYIKHPLGAKFRAVIWLFVVPFVLFIFLQGRAYYFAPAYPIVFAGGAVLFERWLDDAKKINAYLRAGVLVLFLLGGVLFGAVLLPIAPVNSPVWAKANELHDLFREEVGWDDLTETVVKIYNELPPEEQKRTRILTGNYGEAGALSLYGKSRGLPEALSLVNSYWLRGYGNPPPETVILVGFSEESASQMFEECRFAAKNENRFGVENEETRDHPKIFVCRRPRFSWEEFWKKYRSFG